MKEHDLMSKCACVVGATGGIGKAVVDRLEADGWTRIVEMDLNGSIPIDVSRPQSVEDAFAVARGVVPEISLLVVASCVLDLNHVSTLSYERWSEVIAVNLTGPFLCCKAAADWVSDGGRIVLISSLAGRTGGVLTGPAYAASKGGVESLAKSLAQQLAPRRVTVNCVAPGAVDTNMLAANSDQSRDAMVASTPLRRVGVPREVAAAIAYLASEDAGFVTGTVLAVNGGIRMD